MAFANIHGTTVHYRLDGPRGAPVLVLSNSLGTDLHMWAPQLEEFTRQFRVLRYDTRGHGRSGVPPGPYSISGMGQELLALLDAVGVARAHFCGLSMGGMIGQWLGVNAPERIARLVLANTAALIGPASVWETRIEAVRAGGMAAIADGVLARWFTAGFLAGPSARVDELRATLVATSAEGYCACCAAVRDMDQREDVARIGRPTLVIAGRDDQATPAAEGRDLCQRIRGAGYVELEAAHLSNVEQPDRFTEAVLDFLDAGGRS